MNEVKRYKYPHSVERPDLAEKAFPTGLKCFETNTRDFVLASDYEVLEAELAKLREGHGVASGFDYSIKTYATNKTVPQPSAVYTEVEVPEGWRLVPVEPTVEMLDVAISHALAVSLSRDYNWSAYMRDVWLRMVEVAPQQKQNQRKQR